MLNIVMVEKILKQYNIKVLDFAYFELALAHSSYANERNKPSNERIEFLGDAILGFLVAEYIYQNFENMSEGDMSKLRATYVCEEANAKYAIEMNIDKILMLGRGEEMSGGRKRPAILSDAFESFLGAVYLTAGLNEVLKILKVIVFPHILASDEPQFIDYKSQLQEYVQAESRSSLVYTLDTVEGPPHKREFTMSVFLEGLKLGTGSGKTKKEATQQAAKAALEKMA